MILAPLNDSQCLDQVLANVRQWSRSAFAHREAARYPTTADLAAAIRAEPQLDDTGRGRAHALQCDDRVRLREDPRNPNCVERAAWYLAAAEVIDPSLERSLLTVPVTLADGSPARHTNAVERTPGGSWEPVLLQPDAAPIARRNVGAGEVFSDIFKVIHPIGRAVVTYYAGEKTGKLVGDALGGAEDAGVAIAGGDGSTPPPAPATPAAAPPEKTATATPATPATQFVVNFGPAAAPATPATVAPQRTAAPAASTPPPSQQGAGTWQTKKKNRK